MYSHLFCGTIEVEDSDHIKNDDLGIKLYKINLLHYQDLVPDLINLLSASEQNRAHRYHFLKDKNRFILCRVLLKFVLAKHLDSQTAQIIIAIDFNKKPYLDAHPSVFFNVSHAGDFALIAIGKSPIGVDVEYVNRSFDYNEIIPHIFSVDEIDEVKQSCDEHLTFYKFWTRKEAIVKAIGKGIDGNLPKITSTDGLHSVPLSIVGNFNNIAVYGFKINADYLGALALTELSLNIEKINFHPTPTFAELRNSIIN